MNIDKALYRKAYEQYRQWNKARLKDKILHAGELSPEEAWKQYVDLWNVCMMLSENKYHGHRKSKLKDLQKYYDRIQQFESRRKLVGK